MNKPYREDVNAAINAPGGKLAESLLERLWKREPANGSGFPSDLRSCFDDLVLGDTLSHRLARIILASRLFWLHRLDREWARERLISRMRLGQADESGNREAPGLWDGYLWLARIDASLLEDLEQPLLEAALHADVYVLRREKRRILYQLFADVAVEMFSAFEKSELPKALRQMDAEGLVECAHHFRRKLEMVGVHAPALWRNTISRIFDQHWPGVRDKVTPDTSSGLARMLLATREAFPEALRQLRSKGLLSKAKHPIDIIRALNEAGTTHSGTEASEEQVQEPIAYDMINSHTKEVLRLLATIVDSGSRAGDVYGLDWLLARVKEIKPDVVADADYLFLETLLKRG